MSKKHFCVKRVPVVSDPIVVPAVLEYTWELIAANGEVLAGPLETFTTRASCMHNIRLVRDTTSDTPITDEEYVAPEVAPVAPVEAVPAV